MTPPTVLGMTTNTQLRGRDSKVDPRLKGKG